MRFLVIGVDGMIGRELYQLLRFCSESVYGTTRHKGRAGNVFAYLDLTRLELSVLPVANVLYFCAAQSKIGQCRDDALSAQMVNVDSTLSICRHYIEVGARVVFLSSSLVLGKVQNVRADQGLYEPVTEYGRQKAEVEQRLLEKYPSSVAIVRMSKVLSAKDGRFRGWIEEMQSGRIINPFHDLRISPIPLRGTVAALYLIGRRGVPGVYHLGCPDSLSYADAAIYISQLQGFDPARVVSTSCRTVPGVMEYADACYSLSMQGNAYDFGFVFPEARSLLSAYFGSQVASATKGV